MSVYKIFPEADTTLYSAYPSQNTGLDEILEVSVKNSTSVSSEDIRRSIIKFSDTDLQTLQSIKGNSSYDVYLRLFLANAENLNTTYDLNFQQIDSQWSMGTGKFVDSPITKNGANWYSTGSYISATNIWPNSNYFLTPGGGSWTGTTISQSFSYNDNKDINVKVTSFFSNWIAGSANAGILIKHSGSVERNTTSYKVLNFFSKDTHTIFPPCLEIRWDDSSFNTGSLSVVNNNSIELAVTNNPYIIKSSTDKYKFRIAAREKYPARSFSTSSIYLMNKALPSSSFWAIQDVKTEDMIVDFNVPYTKISCDPTSSYFNIYMSGLEPERYYKILVKYVLDSGESIVVDNDSIFKIVR